MGINKWPEKIRPIERLIENGAEFLADEEIVAILLGTGIKGKNAVELAQELLEKHKGIQGLYSFCKFSKNNHKGLGKIKKARLIASGELAIRSLKEKAVKENVLSSPQAVYDFLRLRYGNEEIEKLNAMFLNAQNNVILSLTMQEGTVNKVSVFSREIVKKALEIGATGVILAHNHPGGMLNASFEDMAMTKKVRQDLGLFEIALMDHIIVNKEGFYSLKEQGRL